MSVVRPRAYIAQIIDMPWDWPAEVSYLEAKAFCNWLANKTGKPIRLPTEAEENWLGGVRQAGEPYWTLDALRELLSRHFEMLDEPQNLEFVIRETRRKFQHTVAEVTVWARKS